MENYLSIIVTDGEHEWQQQGIAVPRVGDGVTVRAGGSGVLEFTGTVKEVHWGLTTGAAGMVVTVWLEE